MAKANNQLGQKHLNSPSEKQTRQLKYKADFHTHLGESANRVTVETAV